jgi:sulfatase modifying factor 1
MSRKIVIALCGAVAAWSLAASESRASRPPATSDRGDSPSPPPAATSTPLAQGVTGGSTRSSGWQLFAATPAAIGPSLSMASLASLAAAHPSERAAACPSDMIEVEGDHCPYVQQNCLRWIDPTKHMRCAEFAPSAKCHMQTSHKKFCIDRFEYPNKEGEKPVFMKSWREAKATCTASGKRLCTDSEWTLACEGPEHLPYPYGYKRSKDTCNIDKPYGFPDPLKVYNPATQAAELARLDEREPAGNRASCVSPYGVHDMAGNVDEWVVNETGSPFNSGLKGGYWGPVKTRCRPMTVAHEETFRYYQIGFRCCGGE